MATLQVVRTSIHVTQTVLHLFRGVGGKDNG